jgi:hypothetical protein
MKHLFLFFALISSAFGIAACQQQPFEWNQKLTVAVDTPEGPKSGSAVTNIKVSVGKQWPSGAGLVSKTTGEAVMVEVASGRYLFALLDADATAGLAEAVWRGVLPKEQFDEPAKRYEALQNLRASRAVPEQIYPMLVTFGDLKDPRSVQLVDAKNLAASFGPGVTLKGLTLEITDEAVTKGEVGKVLGWLAEPNPIFIDWTKYPADHPLRRINKSSFKMGK